MSEASASILVVDDDQINRMRRRIGSGVTVRVGSRDAALDCAVTERPAIACDRAVAIRRTASVEAAAQPRAAEHEARRGREVWRIERDRLRRCACRAAVVGYGQRDVVRAGTRICMRSRRAGCSGTVAERPAVVDDRSVAVTRSACVDNTGEARATEREARRGCDVGRPRDVVPLRRRGVPPGGGHVRGVASLGVVEGIEIVLPVEDGVRAVPVEVVRPPLRFLIAGRAKGVTCSTTTARVVGVEVFGGALVLPPARGGRPAIAVVALQ